MPKMIEIRRYRTFLAVIFSFLLGCMLTLNLSIDKTCEAGTNQVYDDSQNTNLNNHFINTELIILILSAPNNTKKRQVVRETWLSLNNKVVETSNKYTSKHYFVIGTLGIKTTELANIKSEKSKYKDILLLPMYDNYRNLTEKVLQSFVWLDKQYNNGLRYKYILKCDDDSFVNLPSLLSEILKMEFTLFNSNLRLPFNLPPEKLNHFITINIQINKNIDINNINLYWGYFNGNARVKSSGKWKEVEWISCDKYVPYALGGGYILSRSLVSFLGKNADYFRTFNSEDTSVGLWLSSVNNIIRIHDIRFDTEWTTRGCKNFYLVTHNISPKEMLVMYDNLVNNKQLCIKEEEKRKYYLYDWSSPPSQCCLTK